MKLSLYRRIAIAILSLTFATAAFADLNESVVLQANTALSLDTGVVGSTGDILWDGSTIVPQGAAKLKNRGKVNSVNYDFIPRSLVEGQAQSAKANPITADLLVVADMFVVVTNGGKIAKAQVLANSAGSLTIQFTTYGASAPAGVPAVFVILNNSSFTPRGSTNYGIAPSSLFVVTGSGLADPGTPVLQSSASGLPLTLNGAAITVVVNGVTTHPALYYTTPTQLAAVLPAATPVGTGTLTVTYRGNTSAPSPIQVVPAALGFNFYNANTAVATDNSTGALLTYTKSGSPGQVIVLWTTGLGANPADSDTTLTLKPHRVNTPLQIYIGGVLATILYQGASAYPGVNQINLRIPQGVPAGCWVAMTAVAANVVSNFVTLPINPGGGPCVDPFTGVTGNQLSPSGGKTLKAGLVSLIQTNAPNKAGGRDITQSANGAFVKYTGLYVPPYYLSPGGCVVVQDLAPAPLPGVTGLDVGTVSLTGPNGLSVALKPFGLQGVSFAQLPLGSIPATGGTFTFTGTGGADVGPFTSTINVSNPILTWTNESTATTIDRSKGLPFTWTGGNPGTYVFIGGVSTAPELGYGSFSCLIPVDAGQFTVPSYVLSALPAGQGGILIQNGIQLPLAATGIDVGAAIATISYSSGKVTFQ